MRFARHWFGIGTCIVLASVMLAGGLSASFTRHAAAAGLWFVASFGSDDPGCGEASSPCKTISYVLTGPLGFTPGDTINLSGVLSESVSITKSVVIIGQSPGATIKTDGLSRVINVANGVSATLSSLVVTNGGGVADGGGIYNEGTLIADRVVISANRAADSGGGIFNANTGVLTITQSAITRNEVTAVGGGGGGIENKGALWLSDTLIEGNKGGLFGGGIDNFDGSVRLTRVVLRKNEASSGAGLFNDREATVDHSAFVENRARIQGGGIYNVGSLVLLNATISGNTLLGGPGAGLDNEGPSAHASLSFVSVVSNTITNTTSAEASGLHASLGSRIEMTGAVIAYNSAKNCYHDGGVFQSFNYNVSSDNQCGFLTQPNDLTGVDPKLAALQLNGGTYTHPPVRNSVLIDAVNPGSCLADDQRGVSRPQGSKCDIGAHEAVVVDLAVSASSDPATLLAGAPLTYTVEVINNTGSPATSVSVTSALPPGISFGACTMSQGSCSTNAGQVSGAFGSVAGGAKVTMTLLVTPTVPGAVTAQFQVWSNEPDFDSGNDVASANADVQTSADLLISSTAPTSVLPGSTYTVTLQVTNSGPSAAQSPTVTTTLPINVQFLSASGPNWACSPSGAVVTCGYQLAELPVGMAPPITIGLIASQEITSLSATSFVSAHSADPNLDNNTVTATSSITMVNNKIYAPIVSR